MAHLLSGIGVFCQYTPRCHTTVALFVAHHSFEFSLNILIVNKKLQEKNKGLFDCLQLHKKCLYRSYSRHILFRGTSGVYCFPSTEHKIAMTTTISAFLMFLGKVVIMGACGVIGFLWLDGLAGLSSPILPVICILVLALCVGSAFLHVYDLGIETILISYCIDLDENKPPRQYKFSNSLAKAAGQKLSVKLNMGAPR